MKICCANNENIYLIYSFQTRFKKPNVIGMIDGTHIGIFPPAVNNEDYPEFVYVNRKKIHSINTQIVSYNKIL